MNCDLMDGRDAFLTLARDKHYEFSSLRRAQFSTLSMLYELHNQGNDKFVYTCNHCKNHVETRYHCTICDVSIIMIPLFYAHPQRGRNSSSSSGKSLTFLTSFLIFDTTGL